MKKHKIVISALCISLLIFAFFNVNFSHSVQETEAAKEPSAQIGAVTIASAVAQTVSAIVPNIPDLVGKIMGGNNKVDKNRVEKALVDQTGETQKVVEAKIQPVAEIATELNTTAEFLYPVTTASENMIRIQTRLNEPLPASDPDLKLFWDKLNEDWTVVKNQMSDIDKIDEKNINKIRNIKVRQDLLTIKRANKDTVSRISKLMDAKDKNRVNELNSLTTKFSEYLKQVPILIGLQLTDLRDDIDELSKLKIPGTPAASPSPANKNLENDVKGKFIDKARNIQ